MAVYFIEHPSGHRPLANHPMLAPCPVLYAIPEDEDARADEAWKLAEYAVEAAPDFFGDPYDEEFGDIVEVAAGQINTAFDRPGDVELAPGVVVRVEIA